MPVDPGESASATLTIRNDGDTVGEFGFTVVGMPSAWTRVEPPTLRLYPGARGVVTATFTPPRSSAAPAGLTPFGIQVRSRENPSLFESAEGTVEVRPFSDVRTELYPVTSRGRIGASPRLRVENAGNALLDVAVTARDDEDGLRFVPTPAGVRVPPGGSVATRLRIRPRGLQLLRAEQRLPYAVTAQLSGPGATGQASRLESRGTFVRRPLIPRWVVALTAAAAAIGALAAGTYAVLPLLKDKGQTFTAAPAVAPLPPAPAATQPGQAGQQSTAPPEPPPSSEAGGGYSKAIVISGARLGDLLTRAKDGNDVGLAQRKNKPAPDVQEWLAMPAGDGTVVLVPVNETSKALKQDKSEATLADFDRNQVTDQQRWRVDDKGNDRFQISNVSSGDCLTDEGTQKKAGVVGCAPNLETQQRWLLLQD